MIFYLKKNIIFNNMEILKNSLKNIEDLLIKSSEI